jgi:hypothetical protein
MTLNVPELEMVVAKALSSDDGEAYMNLQTTEKGRLGVCVINSGGEAGFVLELLVIVLRSDQQVDLDKCFEGIGIAREAQRNGFELTSQGDGWIYCHKRVHREEVEGHCAMMGQIIE